LQNQSEKIESLIKKQTAFARTGIDILYQAIQDITAMKMQLRELQAAQLQEQ